MDIEYTNSKVEWTYNGENVEFHSEGIEFAYTTKDYVRLEVYHNGGFEYYYLSFSGKEICKYDRNGELVIFTASGEQEIKHNSIKAVTILENRIYVITDDNAIFTYDFEANHIGEIQAPAGYVYERFIDVTGLGVVCIADPTYADQYGRVDYKFEYDFDKNEWEKKSLAY